MLFVFPLQVLPKKDFNWHKDFFLPNSNKPTDAVGELEFHRTKKTARVSSFKCGSFLLLLFVCFYSCQFRNLDLK